MPATIFEKRYILHETIGHGGMGTVYRATDRLVGHKVALKRVTAELQGDSSGNDEVDLKLALAREFQFLASLRHPHIISVLDYGFDSEKLPYFTMNLLQEPMDILSAGRNQPLKHQISYLVQTLQAMAYLHRRGILHRDLKPENILVEANQVKLLDFGLSVRDNQGRHIGGTVAYMAPEILMGQSPTVQSDLYALGIIAYELFVGHHPFRSDLLSNLINDILHTPPDFGPLVNEFRLVDGDHLTVENATLAQAGGNLTPVLHRLLAKDPATRYNSAIDVIAAFDEAVRHQIPTETEAIRESFLQAAQFVGREEELTLLTNALAATLEGKGSAWLVGGESGVGKSRLLDELRVRALVQGALVLRGQGTSEGGKPYQNWRNVLRRLVMLSEVDAFEAGVLKSLVPGIKKLTALDSIPDIPNLDAQQAQRRLFEVITSLLQRQVEPLVIIIEDLQWGIESLSLFKYVAMNIQRLPVLLLGSFRDDEYPEMPDQVSHAQHIRLERLTTENIAQLSESMLGEIGRQPTVIDLLQRSSEGNVFYLIEVVRALAEQAGELSEIGRLDLPDNVFAGGARQIVAHRLRHVPAYCYHFLHLAAVNGRQLDLAVLQAAMHSNHLENYLRVCADAAFLTVQDQHWQFTHDQLRHGLLADLDQLYRAELHRQVARAIEQIYPNANEQANVLMHHWRMAGDKERETLYTILAGHQRLSVSAYHEAANLFRAALELTTTVSDQAMLYARLGEVHWRLGEHFQARSRLQTSLKLAQQVNERQIMADALRHLGIVSVRTSDLEFAAQSLRDSLALSREIGDDKGTARCLNTLGIISRRQGRYAEAHEYLQESLKLARATGDHVGEADALENLGILATRTGDYAQSESYLRQALSILRQVRDRASVGNVLISLSQCAAQQGKSDEVRQYYEEGNTIAKEIGNRIGVASALVAFANTIPPDEARQYLEESAFIYRTLGDWAGIATTLFELGRADYRLRNTQRAHAQLTESLEINKRLQYPYGMAQDLTYLGLVALSQEDHDSATTHFREALAIANRIGATPITLAALGGFALQKLSKGDWATAADLAVLIQNHSATTQATREVIRAITPAATSHHELETVVQRFLQP